MKKLESTWYNMAIVLTAICIVSGGALAFVNKMTQEPIRLVQEKQLADGIKAVLNADEVTVESTETVQDEQRGEATIYRTDKGVAVQTSDRKAFGGTMKVLVGFDTEGNILGYRVMETKETPGLGAKADQWFQKGAKGDIIGKQAGTLAVSKDGGEVDAITASTITSRAFLRCVNDAHGRLFGHNADAETGASTINN